MTELPWKYRVFWSLDNQKVHQDFEGFKTVREIREFVRKNGITPEKVRRVYSDGKVAP